MQMGQLIVFCPVMVEIRVLITWIWNWVMIFGTGYRYLVLATNH